MFQVNRYCVTASTGERAIDIKDHGKGQAVDLTTTPQGERPISKRKTYLGPSRRMSAHDEHNVI